MYRRQATPLINVTPLVDVLLILAVILIVAAPMSSKRVPVNPPVAEAAMGGAAKHWKLGYGADKQWYLKGTPVSFEVVKDSVPRGASVELAADGRLPYEEVAKAMDTLRALEPSEFSLTVR